MVLNPKETTIAYRCPVCGTTVMSIIGVFSLSGDHFKLKCPACHQSDMTITYSKDRKIRLSVPCTVCPKPHTFVLSENSFYEKDVFALPCQYTGLDICFIGQEETVRSAAEKSDEALRELLEKAGAESLQSLRGETSDVETVSREDDVQTFDIVNFILTELEEENKIHCKCPEGTSRTYKFDLVGREHDTVLIYCDTCEASTTVKIGDPIAANAFLHIDELDLN